MTTSDVLARQITLLDSLPTTLTPLLRYSYKLFVVPKKAISFRIKQIQTLLTKHPVGYPQPSPLHACQSAKFFAAYHIHATPVFSCYYALFRTTGILYPPCFQLFLHSFYRHGGGYLIDICRSGVATAGEVAPPTRRRCDTQSPRWKSSDSLRKRSGTRNRP
jgi:hypothetical protein